MKSISEKVAYIQGLAEGMKLDTTTDEGRILSQMLDVLADISGKLDDVEDAHQELQNYVEMIDDDMTDIEDYILDMDGIDDDDDDDDLYEVICPNCGAEYLTDFESFEDDDVVCPECGEKFILEEKVVDELTHADDCLCGHHHEE